MPGKVRAGEGDGVFFALTDQCSLGRVGERPLIPPCSKAAPAGSGAPGRDAELRRKRGERRRLRPRGDLAQNPNITLYAQQAPAAGDLERLRAKRLAQSMSRPRRGEGNGGGRRARGDAARRPSLRVGSQPAAGVGIAEASLPALGKPYSVPKYAKTREPLPERGKNASQSQSLMFSVGLPPCMGEY